MTSPLVNPSKPPNTNKIPPHHAEATLLNRHLSNPNQLSSKTTPAGRANRKTVQKTTVWHRVFNTAHQRELGRASRPRM
jgi:hypothetical protein